MVQVDHDGDYDDFKHAAERHCPVAAIQLVRLVIEEEGKGEEELKMTVILPEKGNYEVKWVFGRFY